MRASREHAVKFYADDEALYDTVGEFLGRALVEGNAAVVVAIPAHRKKIVRRLSAQQIDVRAAEQRGDLLVLDAERTVARLLVNNLPDERAFDAIVGTMLEAMTAARGPKSTIAAYGEMVDVLTRRGNVPAALRLEQLWNRAATRFSFSLLCGYAMSSFFNDSSAFEAVCAEHTHIMPPTRNMPAV